MPSLRDLPVPQGYRYPADLCLCHTGHTCCCPMASLVRFSCVLGRWVAIDLFRRLEPNWKSPVGKETLDDGGCNGNRILGDRRNYRVRDRLHRCSEPSEPQRGAWTPTCHVRRAPGTKEHG